MSDFEIRGERGVKSLKNFIKTAFEPVGRVMYIYGGGWNESDDGSGKEAMTLGIAKSIIDFRKGINEGYNFRDYDYKKDKSVIHKGLDCSAYVGWVIYNVFNDGRGYVTNSYKMGDMLENMGYGHVTLNKYVKEQKTGDIMFCGKEGKKHIYISLGELSDKSVLLLHSSPPGVQLSGTFAPNGNKNSLAVETAEKYMKKYYGDWYCMFPENSRDASYINEYDKFSWSVLRDEEGFYNMTPVEVLEEIFK